MIANLRATIDEMRTTIINLYETLDELKRKLFGSSREWTKQEAIVVKGYTRTKKKKSVHADLYEVLSLKGIHCDVPWKAWAGDYSALTLKIK